MSHLEPQTLKINHLDRLTDDILLLVFSKIGDVKSLGRCNVVSRRLHSLIPQVQNVNVNVDFVLSDDESRSTGSLSNIVRSIGGSIAKPLQKLGQFLGSSQCPGSSSSSSVYLSYIVDDEDREIVESGVKYHSLTQVLKKFEKIRYLHIKLPSDESEIDAKVLLKWRAEFGSTLDNCVVFSASSVIPPNQTLTSQAINTKTTPNGAIPDSFYRNGGLKLRVVWSIRCLVIASTRHYLLQPIITKHKTFESLTITESDGRGVVCMNKDQLEEVRKKPLLPSLDSKRTIVPDLKARLWYAPTLELPDGTVLKGTTLVAIRPSESKKEGSDISWVTSALEEPYQTAAKMLVKGKTYSLEMNSF